MDRHILMNMVGSLAETNWSHGGDNIIIQKGCRLENHVGGVIGVFIHKPSSLFFLNRYLETIHLKTSDFRIVEINPRDLSAQFITKVNSMLFETCP